MGYELKLKVGRASKPLIASEKFNFLCDITINLSCCGDSNINNVAQDSFSDEALPKVEWYEGDKTITEDGYGKKPSPVLLAKIIEALKKDTAQDNYRRFQWALATLEAVDRIDSNEEAKEFSAIFEGY